MTIQITVVMILGRDSNVSSIPYQVVVFSTPRGCALFVPKRAASVVRHVSTRRHIVGILWHTGIVAAVRMSENVVREVVNCVASNKYAQMTMIMM